MVLLKNHHKAPINRVIDTTEDEEVDNYGRSQTIPTQEKMINDARNKPNIYQTNYNGRWATPQPPRGYVGDGQGASKGDGRATNC